MVYLPEMGLHPQLFQVLREREIETQLGQVQMNCEMCKFRLAAVGQGDHHHHHSHDHSHDHDHSRDHHHSQGHSHAHPASDPYAEPEQYHQRIWQVP
jgi:sirohydrochlorin cobaltochelatase